MYGKLGLFILLVYLVCARARKNGSCDAGNTYPYTGIKTPYIAVYNDSAIYSNLTNCKPLQIWLLNRHGTRFPKESTILEMLKMAKFRDRVVENHMTLQGGNLCNTELMALKDWEVYPELDPRKGKELSFQGKMDLQSIGSRFQRKFPELFHDAPQNYKFRSTDTSRTIDSMKYFIKGAFKNKFSARTEVVPAFNDTLLKIYENCEAWKEGNFHEEVKEFINGPEIAKVVIDVSSRLGFEEEMLSKKEVFLLYDLCRFERAWKPLLKSPWCAAFTEDDMHVLEYEEDLYHYYSVGYGRDINSKLGCHPLRDMFDRFTKLEKPKDSDEPRGVFYFTHSEMIMLFLDAIGIAKDSVHLKASNYKQMDHRKWRSSLLVPFATNFAAVFYSCDSSSLNKVAFYLAENPLTLDGCSDGVCDWAQLKKKLKTVVENCSTDVCRKAP